jgi:hypothetical protein
MIQLLSSWPLNAKLRTFFNPATPRNQENEGPAP